MTTNDDTAADDFPSDPSMGACAFFLATCLPAACGVPREDLTTVWTHEWTDEDETWGIALNGTGANRLWYGSLYTFPTDDVVAVSHPAGTAVVGVDQQALGVLKPDSNEWFCERDEIGLWEKATVYTLYDHLRDLDHDVPQIDDLLDAAAGASGGEPA